MASTQSDQVNCCKSVTKTLCKYNEQLYYGIDIVLVMNRFFKSRVLVVCNIENKLNKGFLHFLPFFGFVHMCLKS